MSGRNGYMLVVCAAGIYASFLTWALVQEPLNTNVWPNSKEQFHSPNVIAIVQASAAMLIGYFYLKYKGTRYSPLQLFWDYKWDMALTSFTQSTSAPLASYSLQYVDYLTYMLAKSCKMIPILMVHLLLYRAAIPQAKKIVAILVTLGVVIFTIGSNNSKIAISDQSTSMLGYFLLSLSLFLDGLTNATQDKMLKSNKLNNKDAKYKLITGAHLMFALNMFIIIWNVSYLIVIDRTQWDRALHLMTMDVEIYKYLVIYAICGALGQCFIFYTLENYGSLVLVMITVTRKIISMILSIVVFGKAVKFTQWIGIGIVFGGITWEAMNKNAESAGKDISKEIKQEKAL